MNAPVLDVIDEQHDRLLRLFEQVSDPGAERTAVLHRILQEMAAHVAAERAAVEPVVKERSIGGDGLAGELAEDYKRIEELMVLIERRKFNSPDVPGLVTDLKDAYEAHVQRSREHLEPALGQLDPEEQRQLGEKLSTADDVVVTHPHPHLLGLGPIGSKLLGFVSRFDRLRDKAHPARPDAEDDNPSMGGAT